MTHQWSPQLLENIANAREMLAAVQTLIAAGVPVFPCARNGKNPLTGHGFHDASTDLARIRSWWRRWPEANIGIPTGGASGVDVVDVDVHPAGTGFPAFNSAGSAGYLNGWAWLVRTPSGGVHAYYTRGPDREQRSWQSPASHVDFRGDGGYIITPPSKVATSGGAVSAYRLIAVAQHTPTPVDGPGLRAFIDPPQPTPALKDFSAVGAQPAKLAAWVASRPEGGRNAGLFWAACRLAEDGHDLTATLAVLGDAGCSAGLPAQEVLSTIRSAYRTTTRSSPPSHHPPPAPAQAAEAVSL